MRPLSCISADKSPDALDARIEEKRAVLSLSDHRRVRRFVVRGRRFLVDTCRAEAYDEPSIFFGHLPDDRLNTHTHTEVTDINRLLNVEFTAGSQ